MIATIEPSKQKKVQFELDLQCYNRGILPFSDYYKYYIARKNQEYDMMRIVIEDMLNQRRKKLKYKSLERIDYYEETVY